MDHFTPIGTKSLCRGGTSPRPVVTDGNRAKEKELKWMRKNPYRQMPIPNQYPSATAPAQMHTTTLADPLSFMLHSTGEEFGVRRPFDAPGLPRSLGGPAGHAGWPMMSRTMTHVSTFTTPAVPWIGGLIADQAVQDLSREERVHAIQVSRASRWGGVC